MSLRLLSHAEQVAAHLRGEVSRGRWRNVLPGIQKLSVELGVNHNTLEAALRLLEEEGVVAAQGHGRPRQVCAAAVSGEKRSLRVKILLYEAEDRLLPDHVELLARLQEAGHAADFAPKTLQDLGMEVGRVARFVAKHPAEAWVVCSASEEILTWFSTCPVPSIAMYGRFTGSGIPIAGVSPRKSPAMVTAVRKLVSLGHRRIVMLTREERRKPKPALYEQNFLNELAALGIPTGAYNLPDWEETPAGLHACLDALFRHTPPTALILGDASFILSIQQYLAKRGVVVPDHMSLICSDPDPTFPWCHPAISHIRWDYRPLVQRVLRWTDHIACGRSDLKQTLFLAEFVEGGTIGPVGK
jgi:hypothetical protein